MLSAKLLVKILTFTLMVCHGLSQVVFDALTRDRFNQFLVNTKKSYSSPTEYQFRLNVFASKKKQIDSFNALNLSYKKGLNYFSDMTQEERRSFLGENGKDGIGLLVSGFAKKSEGRRLQDNFQLQNDLIAKIKPKIPKDIFKIMKTPFDDISPQVKDWAAEGKITPVKHQKSCGGCWAFAAIASLESAYKIAQGVDLSLSEQEIMDCSKELGSDGCQGGFSQGALQYIQEHGVHSSSTYPYIEKDQPCQSVSGSVSRAFEVNSVPNKNMLEYIRNLRDRPLTTSFWVVDSFFDYSTGIYDAAAECTNMANVGTNHAVLAVGYDLSSPSPFIKLKNSWGSDWGESGYFRMPLQKVQSQDGPCNLIKNPRIFYPTVIDWSVLIRKLPLLVKKFPVIQIPPVLKNLSSP